MYIDGIRCALAHSSYCDKVSVRVRQRARAREKEGVCERVCVYGSLTMSYCDRFLLCERERERA